MNIARLSIAAALVAVFAGAGPALAQTQLFRSVNAQTGKVTRLLVMPGLKKDCSAAPTPEIRVVTPPKNGTVALEKAKLKTPASYRCPNIEAQVQGAVYKPNAKFAGSDEVVLESKGPDGDVERTTIRITVSERPSGLPKSKDPTDL